MEGGIEKLGERERERERIVKPRSVYPNSCYLSTSLRKDLNKNLYFLVIILY